MSSNPKLRLTQNEKTKLRKAKVKISEVHTLSTEQLAQMLNIPDERARTVKGLAEFQTVPSIGYKNDPNSSKQWFDFTNERKKYREKVGYPEGRPKTAWYE
ncbi:hypothetical protein [Niallia sp. RD1]|uniref:hypothetical protein n=1 Tax=Niallia sp. RD1 TaxID=2962858 RepID=UPI0020C19DB6|nr:hypothetical protein [Niallia sp. RD1]UTI41029.1 hypothetical protein NKG37_19490 [Niallia sp. RD1]